jgi:hypothetical protein
LEEQGKNMKRNMVKLFKIKWATSRL